MGSPRLRKSVTSAHTSPCTLALAITSSGGRSIERDAAVLWQTHKGATVLSSVSAYYYTAAQPIFVGALIGLAACVTALRGTNAVEDVALKLPEVKEQS